MNKEVKTKTIRLFDVALVLTTLFTVMKATNIIHWGWVWIFFPLILYAAIMLMFMIGIASVCIVAAAVKDKPDRK